MDKAIYILWRERGRGQEATEKKKGEEANGDKPTPASQWYFSLTIN